MPSGVESGTINAMKRYIPKEVEAKWQKVWADSKIYEVSEDKDRQKIYATPMLPYPSGAGLHVGHVRNYSIADAVARFYRQRGYNVMSNMGWDSFGLPAENYAIKTGTPPDVSTAENIKNFRTQLKRLGMSYDWSREINTSNPEYYKWTQWLFNQFYENGLAYQAENLQWWCTKCKTVLANEQVIGDKCWRHEGPDDPVVEKRRTKQWFFKITKYADQLLENLEDLDWPESITSQQYNWIGKSQGAEIEFELVDNDRVIKVFTTRPDTIFGATFMVLAPENPLIEEIVSQDQKAEVEKYVAESIKKSDIDRMDEGKEKTGVFSGSYAINPATKEKIPIWISDFVLGGYGTGAIMAVPGHDQRDNEFARKFNLPIVEVVAPEFGKPLPNSVDVTGPVVVGYDPKIDKFMRLENTKNGMLWFAAGGLEGEESYAEAAIRELAEEAGVRKCKKLIQLGGPNYSYFYNPNKDSNRRSFSYMFLAIIDHDDVGEQALESHEQYEVVWSSAEEIFEELEKTREGREHWIDGMHRAVAAVEMYKAGIEFFMPAYSGEGCLFNSGSYSGMSTAKAREQIITDLEKQGVAKAKVNYKMRDWLISRQRYWGAPIPIIHCKGCGAVPVPDKDLPVKLPKVDNFEPTGDSTSILASVESWVNVDCPKCSQPAKRETDTLDGYVCSSWYMHRYTDPHNEEMAWDVDKLNYWFPVDFYFGGDHAVAHLLYFRFWNLFFADQGLIDKSKAEPIKKLVFNGYINADDGRKMSKSLGNVVDPLEIIESGYGADALRMFELFAGPYDQDVAWNPNGVPGTYRYLQRVWALVQDFLDSEDSGQKADPEKVFILSSTTHKTIKRVTNDLETQRFNTAIAACMELVNSFNSIRVDLPFADAYQQWRQSIAQLLQMLAPFAPHVSEELWTQLGFEESIHISGWPIWDEQLIKEDVVTVVVQVNGKLRAKLELPIDTEEQEAIALALKEENVQNFVQGKTIIKQIFVKNRLINFAVK